MPTILRSGPYRVYFYSHEPNEPPHVHVDRDKASCKVWLAPVALASSLGFSARELREIVRLVSLNKAILRKHGRSFMVNPGERVTDVALTEDRLIVDLADGRTVSVPLAWFPRLLHATSQERDNWEIAGAGYGIHWPDVDEDLSVEGLLRGAPAPQARTLAS
jgi:hypothetical protein